MIRTYECRKIIFHLLPLINGSIRFIAKYIDNLHSSPPGAWLRQSGPLSQMKVKTDPQILEAYSV